MRTVGITGPTGAGKSLLSGYMRKKGIPVIDADEVYHSLLVPPSLCLDALRGAFGDIIFKGEELDRRILSDIVFHDEEKLTLLNRTVLGFVLERIREMLGELRAEGHTVAAVDAPTLIESGFYLECDTVVSVISSPEIRVERIILRDGLTREAAEARVHAQRDDGFYIEKSDIVLTNDRDEVEFFDRCEELVLNLGGAK
ncbi:MAG: dephospho-CoA kinase [Clostridia bacterium]|nr:dephospho-CoA kinase [Clostridia bacterium]